MDYEHEQLNNPKKYANPAGAKLLEYIREDPLWRDIEKELSDVLMYQNLE